jgi:RNA polymerase sigma-70 factor, ECF subfamily
MNTAEPPAGDVGRAPVPPEGFTPAASEVASRDRGGHLRLVEGEMYADWESAYRDNVTRVYRLMFSRVGNRPDAEDLTSEVFRAALGPLRLNSSKGEVRAYLVTTAQTVLASHWRRRFGLEVTAIDPDAGTRYIEQESALSDAPERAAGILEGLPDRYRRVLELRFLEACSIKEAAREMGISVANAKVLQHRALRMAAAAHGAEP